MDDWLRRIAIFRVEWGDRVRVAPEAVGRTTQSPLEDATRQEREVREPWNLLEEGKSFGLLSLV